MPRYNLQRALFKYNLNDFKSAEKTIELGYFKSLVSPIKIYGSDIFMSPNEFCEQPNGEVVYHLDEEHFMLDDELKHGVENLSIEESSNFDKDLCLEALFIMLKQTDGDPQVEYNRFQNLSGNDAFQHVYFNYKFLSISDEIVFPEAEGSDNVQYESINKSKFDIMERYYIYLMDKAEQIDFLIFPTADDYCRSVVARKT